MAPSRSSCQRLLDAGFYAPVGFLVSREKAVEDLADTGRKQLAFSRSLGRAAIKSLTRGLQTEPDPRTDRGDSGEVSAYVEMSARELIGFIAGCSKEQAVWLRSAEQAGKNRVTVLRALEKRLQPS